MGLLTGGIRLTNKLRSVRYWTADSRPYGIFLEFLQGTVTHAIVVMENGMFLTSIGKSYRMDEKDERAVVP